MSFLFHPMILIVWWNCPCVTAPSSPSLPHHPHNICLAKKRKDHSLNALTTHISSDILLHIPCSHFWSPNYVKLLLHSTFTCCRAFKFFFPYQVKWKNESGLIWLMDSSNCTSLLVVRSLMAVNAIRGLTLWELRREVLTSFLPLLDLKSAIQLEVRFLEGSAIGILHQFIKPLLQFSSNSSTVLCTVSFL